LLADIVRSARQKLTSFDDLLFLADICSRVLKDPDMAAQLYAEAEKKARSRQMLSRLATCLGSQLNDSKWGSRVLRKINTIKI